MKSGGGVVYLKPFAGFRSCFVQRDPGSGDEKRIRTNPRKERGTAMKNRWIAGLLAVCMMLTVTMGSLPAMAAQDEITDDLRGENTTSEPLTTALQEAVQASLAADAAEGEQPTTEPTGEPGTSSQAAGEPIEDYSFVYAGNTFQADLETDASGAKVATITKVEDAGAGATPSWLSRTRSLTRRRVSPTRFIL